MKHFKLFLVLAVLFVFIACNSRQNDKAVSIIKNDSVIKQDTQQLSIISDWPAPIYYKLNDVESFFVKQDSRQYDCYDLQKYYTDYGTKLNRDGLFQVSGHICKQLFGNYSNDYGTFCNSYLYSIEKPLGSFYPITVVQNFGVAERSLIMLLYNAKGEIVTSFEVANLYGEGGGCLSSHFLNDSTLIQNFKWDDFGVDTLTHQDIHESEYLTQQLIVSKSGKIYTKELKRWKEIK